MLVRRRVPAVLATGLVLTFTLLGSPFAESSFAGTESIVIALPVKSRRAQPNPRLEKAVLIWLNRARTSRGLQQLRSSAAIQNVARAYGLDMFAHGYLSHTSLNGHTLQDRLAEAGLQPQVAGENLAYAGTVRDAERALWLSEPHRRNILYPDFRDVGIAVIDGGDEGLIVVQDFADDPLEMASASRPDPLLIPLFSAR
jgi:uncharacterized protein YkwD